MVYSVVVWYVCSVLIVLVVGGLGTVYERKVLGGVQRRCGPSVCGWFGVGVLVADGVKLAYKETGSKSTGLVVCVLVGMSVGLLGWLGFLWMVLCGKVVVVYVVGLLSVGHVGWC